MFCFNRWVYSRTALDTVTFRSSCSTLSTCGFSWQKQSTLVAACLLFTAVSLPAAAAASVSVTLQVVDDVEPLEESFGTTYKVDLFLVWLTRTQRTRAKQRKAIARTQLGSEDDDLSLRRKMKMDVITDNVDSASVAITNTPDHPHLSTLYDDHLINLLQNRGILVNFSHIAPEERKVVNYLPPTWLL